MANHQKNGAGTEKRAEAGLSAMDHECDSASGAYRLPVAEFAERFSEMENGLQCVLALAEGWDLAGHP